MAFKMKGSPIKLGSIATKSALEQAESPMKQHSAYTSEEDYAPKEHLFTTGKGKRTRFQQRKGSTGSNPGEVQWIRDNYGTNLSKKELRKAQQDYYNVYSSQLEPEPTPEKEQQYTGNTYEKEVRYPKSKRGRGFADSYLPLNEVWDPNVNQGTGGYVRVEEDSDETPTEIPEFKGTVTGPGGYIYNPED